MRRDCQQVISKIKSESRETAPPQGTLPNAENESEGEKVTPKQWKSEIQSLQAEYDSISKEKSKTATELAYAELIGYNKKNLERELQNKGRQPNRQQSKAKKRKKFNENLIEI